MDLRGKLRDWRDEGINSQSSTCSYNANELMQD